MIYTENNVKFHGLTKPRSTYPHWPVPNTDTHWSHSPCGCHQSLPQSNQECLVLISAFMQNSYIINVRKFARSLHITEKLCFALVCSLLQPEPMSWPVDFPLEDLLKYSWGILLGRYFISSITITLTPGSMSIEHGLKHKKIISTAKLFLYQVWVKNFLSRRNNQDMKSNLL